RRAVETTADGDGLNPAAALDFGHRRLVDVGQRLPEDVAAGGFDQEGLLADGELRLGDDPGDAGLDRVEAVVVVPAHGGQRRPLLALGADVLPVVLADGAGGRRLGARRVLRTAGDADVLLGTGCVSGRHGGPSAVCCVLRGLPLTPDPSPTTGEGRRTEYATRYGFAS